MSGEANCKESSGIGGLRVPQNRGYLKYLGLLAYAGSILSVLSAAPHVEWIGNGIVCDPKR